MSTDWGPVIVAVSLFILLSPGLLFQIPARTRVVEFGNMSTSESKQLLSEFERINRVKETINTTSEEELQIQALVYIKGTPLLHSYKENRERDTEHRSTSVDVEIDGDDQNGVNGEEDESVNSNGFSVGFEVTEVHSSVVYHILTPTMYGEL
ncbi:RNase H domain-containing protein [Raphanus sativus]|nr:RNase H domain-containing protein [Raphanus sativus]